MNAIPRKMSEAGSGSPVMDVGVGSPKKGERFRCQKCGMEVQVTADCRCDDPSHVHFHCCGQELEKV